MDIKYVFIVLCVILSLFAVRSIVGFVNARAKARAAGGVKIYVRTPLVVVDTIACAVVLGLSVKQFSESARYRRSAEEYELLKTSAGYADYLKDAIAERDGVNVTDPQKYIENYIDRLNGNAEDELVLGISYVVFALFVVSLSLGAIWFFTDEGVIFMRWKAIEPITAVRMNGHIVINVSVQLKDGSTLLVVKDDPKNLARFGRYIEWENETEDKKEEELQ